MYKIEGTLIGGFPDPENPEHYVDYSKVLYARTQIGLSLKTLYLKLFFDWVNITEVDNKERI